MNIYLKRIKKFLLFLHPSKNKELSKRGKHFIRLKELCSDIIVERRRKLTAFVMRPHVKNKTKMNHGWSQSTCTLTVLSLKRKRGAYWNETAYWNKGATKEEKTNSRGCPLKRGRLLSTVLNILLFDRVSSRFVKSNCLEINSQSVTLMVPYLLDWVTTIRPIISLSIISISVNFWKNRLTDA